MKRGMIHGRFQPFHNGHLEYMRGAAERCDELWVGITNPDPARILPEASDPARHLPESNPYTYDERLLMVKAAAARPRARPGARARDPVPGQRAGSVGRVRAGGDHAVPAALLRVGRREARAPVRGRATRSWFSTRAPRRSCPGADVRAAMRSGGRLGAARPAGRRAGPARARPRRRLVRAPAHRYLLPTASLAARFAPMGVDRAKT